MNNDNLVKAFKTYKSSAFRLQTLASYAVSQEDEDYAKFLAGEPFPARQGNAWLEEIKANTQAGKEMTNVHLLPPRLTPYLRYGIDWWYTYREAVGEHIRFVLADVSSDFRKWLTEDFWLFDDTIAIKMCYDRVGAYLGSDLVSEQGAIEHYRYLRDLAIRNSIDLRAVLIKRRQGDLL